MRRGGRTRTKPVRCLAAGEPGSAMAQARIDHRAPVGRGFLQRGLSPSWVERDHWLEDFRRDVRYAELIALVPS